MYVYFLGAGTPSYTSFKNPLYWLVQFRGYISVTAILFVYLKCASLVHELKWKYRVAKMPARVKATVLDR